MNQVTTLWHFLTIVSTIIIVISSISSFPLLLQICLFVMALKLLNGCVCLKISGKLLSISQVVNTITNLIYDLTE